MEFCRDNFYGTILLVWHSRAPLTQPFFFLDFSIINLPSIIYQKYIESSNCHTIFRWYTGVHCGLHITLCNNMGSIKLYVGKIDCHDFATMHSCTPSKNCMAMNWFYILLIDYGRQVYCWKMAENILQCRRTIDTQVLRSPDFFAQPPSDEVITILWYFSVKERWSTNMVERIIKKGSLHGWESKYKNYLIIAI